jgi:predicted MFS family arabinose efflux permease
LRALFSARLGADFTRLWIASAISTVGDGVTMAAGPLLVASLTDDPAAIGGAVFAQQLPWLLFSLVGGAVADRLDRRRLLVTVNLLRGAALAVLAGSIATATVSVALTYAVFFLVGVADTVAGPASGALLPAIVPADLLPTANARLGATFTIGNQFAAKPLGAWLFVVSATLPFGFDALTFVAAALLLAGIRPLPQQGAAPAGGKPRGAVGLRREIGEGVRWLWGHRLLRTLAVAMGCANVAFCAAFSVFVLYCRDRLGLSDVEYGLVLTTFAVGGLGGTVVAARLEAALGSTRVLRAGLIVEVVTHLTLATTRTPLIAAAVLVVFGVHTMVWGVIVATLRQRLVPSGLQGRVGSVYALIDVGGAALGSLGGALLAQSWSVTTPFWMAAAAMAVITVVAWRRR